MIYKRLEKPLLIFKKEQLKSAIKVQISSIKASHDISKIDLKNTIRERVNEAFAIAESLLSITKIRILR